MGEKRRENSEVVAASAAAYIRSINYTWPEQRRLILSLVSARESVFSASCWGGCQLVGMGKGIREKGKRK